MKETFHVEDVFQRQFFADSIINLVRKVRSPYSIGIDAKWGNGKTTFVKQFLSKAAEVQKVPIVIFDCFEHERAGDPLFSITQHILASLTPAAEESPRRDAILSALKGLAVGTGKVIVNTALQTLVKQNLSDFLSNFTNEEIAETAASNTTEKLEEFLAEKLQDGFKEKAIHAQFKKSVEELADSLSESAKIIVVIDELDRCRPNFAIDVLEAMKHILHVPGLVFVLSYHREQLCNSIEHQFGKGIDANLYLHKFVNIDFSLPNDEVKNSESGFYRLIGSFVRDFTDNQSPTDEIFLSTLFQLHVFYDLEIRTLARCIGIFYSTDATGPTTTDVLTVLIVWSVRFPNVMLKLKNNIEINDDDLSELRLQKLSGEYFANQIPYNRKISLIDHLSHILGPSDESQRQRAENAKIAIQRFLSFN